MPKPDLAFIDKVHDWTFFKRRLGHALSKEVQGVQARLRAKLRTAQRFIVDDDAVAITAGLSREFNRLEAWSFLARLPYDTMWLQFNLHCKIESLRALDDRMLPLEPDNVSPVIGYLLYRDTDGPTPVWIAHEFYQDEHGVPFVGMLAYVFDPEGDPMWPIRGSKFWRAPTLSLRKGFPRQPVTISWGASSESGGPLPDVPIYATAAPEIALCGIFQPRTSSATVEITDKSILVMPDEEVLTAPSWFVNRGAVIIDPWWDHYFAKRWQDDPDSVHRLIGHEISECRGAMKFLITLLAAINGLPRDVKPIATRTGHRTVGMHRLPYLGHSHLRLELPRDNRVVYARRTLDRSAGESEHRRSHLVRGHWRVVERGKRVQFLCRHMPTMVEHGLGICENCEMMIRWIPQHTRGKDDVGMVDHDYEVTTKRTRKSA